ncbi:hypothetical protein CRENBAI_017473, partial [Crenichthys baileyi]
MAEEVLNVMWCETPEEATRSYCQARPSCLYRNPALTNKPCGSASVAVTGGDRQLCQHSQWLTSAVTVGKTDAIATSSEISSVFWVNLNEPSRLIIPNLRLAGENETIRATWEEFRTRKQTCSVGVKVLCRLETEWKFPHPRKLL